MVIIGCAAAITLRKTWKSHAVWFEFIMLIMSILNNDYKSFKLIKNDFLCQINVLIAERINF